MIRLTIHLRDGREFSGVYHWVDVLARIQSLAEFGNVVRWHLEEA